MIESLLDEHVRSGRLNAVIRSAGFDATGGDAPTDTAVRLLQARDIDVSGYQSHILGTTGVTGADLIVTSEQQQVVSVAGRWPEAYRYTFTLPELVEIGERVGARRPRTYADWLAAVHAQRPEPIDYLDTTVGEIVDPTGRSPATWSACFKQIDDLTSRLTDLLA
jgi:protein-tyrosine-phosphatase